MLQTKAVDHLSAQGKDVVFYEDKEIEEEMPGFQLQCVIPIFGSNTCNQVDSMEQPFLYVKKA